MDKILRRTFYILLYIAIFLSFSYIVMYYINMKNTKAQSNLLNEIHIDTTSIPQDDEPTKPIKTERMLKLEELQKENSDIIGWIEISDTNINYPVLQGTDNDFYMTHNYEKKYASSGSIFLDKDYSWEPQSTNLLIYGHNMKNGTMFKDLLKYKDKNFFDSHPSFRFTTVNEDMNFEIISVFQSKVYYKHEQNVFRYYYFINAKNEDEFNSFVTNAKNASLYDTTKTANYGDLLMTLSTCAYHTEDRKICCSCKEKIKN